MKSAPSNLSNYKIFRKKKMPKCLIANILWRKNNAKIWDKNCLIWVFLRCHLKTILSYLKSAPSNLPSFKISSKIKISKFETKTALFGYFWARILKNFSQIWNQHPRSRLIANFCDKLKMPKFGPKMLYLGIFGLKFENCFVIFEISLLEFV